MSGWHKDPQQLLALTDWVDAHVMRRLQPNQAVSAREDGQFLPRVRQYRALRSR